MSFFRNRTCNKEDEQSNNQGIESARAKERGLKGYYKLRKAELISLLRASAWAADAGSEIIELFEEWGATSFDDAMRFAALEGDVEIVKLCKGYGATDFDGAIRSAAFMGRVEIVKLCRECGATSFDDAMIAAAAKGHVEIVKLCLEWGATGVREAVLTAIESLRIAGLFRELRFTDVGEAAEKGHIEIVKLCGGWFYAEVHRELFRYHHKREFFEGIRDELLPVTWHPDRFFDWCLDEEEREFLKEMWRI